VRNIKKIATENDAKAKSAEYNDKKKGTVAHQLKKDDFVLVGQKRLNKWTTKFNAIPQVVTDAH